MRHFQKSTWGKPQFKQIGWERTKVEKVDMKNNLIMNKSIFVVLVRTFLIITIQCANPSFNFLVRGCSCFLRDWFDFSENIGRKYQQKTQKVEISNLASISTHKSLPLFEFIIKKIALFRFHTPGSYFNPHFRQCEWKGLLWQLRAWEGWKVELLKWGSGEIFHGIPGKHGKGKHKEILGKKSCFSFKEE